MRALILERAMKLFVEEGYANVSIRRLAEAIEYSPATIYLYFRDKDAILYALCMDAFRKFYEHLRPVTRIADPKKRLCRLGESYIAFALDHPEHYDLMFIMRSPGASIVAEQDWEESLRSYELLRTTIADCAASGALPKETDVDAASFAFWSFVHGVASLAIRQRLAMIPAKKLRATINGALAFMMGSVGRTE